MNPEAIARLRHSLRTPLNHIIGYADLIRQEAQDQTATAEVGVMDQVLTAAREIEGHLEEALPVRAHILEEAIAEFRKRMAPSLTRIDNLLKTFDELSGSACAREMRKIRVATKELWDFARGSDPTVRAIPVPLPPRPERESARDPRSPGAKVTGRILVVDDDPDNREILTRRLDREGFEAISVSSGPAALERLGQEPFDLVLLDIFMPVMDGFEVLRQMKTRLELQEIPVIVLSALDDQANAVRSIEMGAEDFIAKPYDAVILRARIGAILRRRRAEAERAEMADSLQLLLESTGEGVVGEDAEGRCVFANRASLEMLRCSREQLVGRDLHAAVHHTRPDGTPYPVDNCPIRQVLRTGAARRGRDEFFIRADGSAFPIEYSAHPIRREGHNVGVVVTFTDITDRKRSEENLLQSAKLESLGVLAGGIAHDFNNILTGILGNASFVLETLPKNDPNRNLLSEVVTAGERAADLTRQMLAFAGKGQFVVEPVDFSRSIQEVSELLAATLPKPVRLDLRLGSQLATVEADSRQLQQLVFNLVLNAGEAIGERPGRVTIETGVRDLPEGLPAQPPFGRLNPGRYVFASVQDTGAGIDPATRPRIFDPFFSTKFTGRGLGLAAAMGIVRAHHGAIHVESEPGRGSRFEILLPAMRTRAIPMPAASTDVVSRTILVVDDEEVVRRTTQAVLERKGFRVLLAEDGQRAVDILRDRAAEISLVLLDLTMPVMGGEEAARYMRAIRHDLPILVSSGFNETEVLRRFAGLRVAGYLRKPYTSATLIDRIQSLV